MVSGTNGLLLISFELELFFHGQGYFTFIVYVSLIMDYVLLNQGFVKKYN